MTEIKMNWYTVYFLRHISGKKIKSRKQNDGYPFYNELVEVIKQKFGISIVKTTIKSIVTASTWPDPNWNAYERRYVGIPRGWNQRWGDWSN